MKKERAVMSEKMVYPYVPNSAPEVKAAMLKEIGVEDVSVFYQDVPEKLRKTSATRCCSWSAISPRG